MIVRFGRTFTKQYDRADVKIKRAFDRKFELLLADLHHPQLNNHALTGKYTGFRSINITGDWRALYSEYLDEEGTKTVVFEILGTHSQLYR